MNLEIDILRTPNPLSMIELMADYSWALNLPLNGDFNRRFVECFLARTCIISEQIPDSQLFFPYSLFKNSILFFRNPDEIPGLLLNNRDKLEFLARSNFKRCVDLFDAGYEESILADFVKPLVEITPDVNVQKKPTSHEVSNILGKAYIYEDLLNASLYADQLSCQQKNELIYKGKQFIGDLYDVQNEFYRLSQ
jgi:hypothetical protein